VVSDPPVDAIVAGSMIVDPRGKRQL